MQTSSGTVKGIVRKSPLPPPPAPGSVSPRSAPAASTSPRAVPAQEDRLRTGTVAITENKNSAAKAEMAMLAAWINDNMVSAAQFASVSEATLCDRVREGSLLPLLLRSFFGDVAAVVEALSGVAAAKSQRNAFELVESHNAALRSCAAAGVKVVSIAGADLAEGKAGVVLAVLSQLVREALLKKVAQSSSLQQLGDAGESSETLLLRFVNSQLKAAGSARVADNWTSALQDCEVLAVLLGQVAGIEEDKINAVLAVADLTSRAEALLQLAEQAGVRSFVTAQSIVGGKDKDRNVMFCANLLARFGAGRAATVEQLQALLEEKERLYEEDLSKNEATVLGLGGRMEGLLAEIAQLKQRVRELEAANAALQEQLNGAKLGSERLAMELAEQNAAFELERQQLQTTVAEVQGKSGAEATGLLEQVQKWQAETKREKLSAANLAKQLKQSEAKAAQAEETLRETKARLADAATRHAADLREVHQAVAAVGAKAAEAESKTAPTVVRRHAPRPARDDDSSIIEPEEAAPAAPSASSKKARMQRRVTLGIRPDAQWAVEREEGEGEGEERAEAGLATMLAELKKASDEIGRLASLVLELRAENAQLKASSQDELLQERLRREAEQRRMEQERQQEAELTEEKRRLELLRIKGILQEIQAEGYVFKKGRIMGSWKQVYMLLRDNNLLFFGSHESAHEPRSKPTSVVSCDLVRMYESSVADGKYETLELGNIEGPDKIVLGFSSSTEKEYWVQSIKGAKKKRVLEVGIKNK